MVLERHILHDGMPRLPDTIERCVGYLYRNAADARAGRDPGGTAFFVSVELSPTSRFAYTYAVTNWHVACKCGYSCLRVNTKDGGVDVFEFDPSDWHFDAAEPRADIAVVELAADPKKHDVTFLPPAFFATDGLLASEDIRAGEDVFMVGLFTSVDGQATNRPALRFGNISTVGADVRSNNWGSSAPSHIIDLHSRAGYSGSPVFVYRTFGSDLTRSKLVGRVMKPLLYLLGIHWGQFPEKWSLRIGAALVEDEAHSLLQVPSGDQHIEGFSGMSVVHPASEIMKVLNMPPLKDARDRDASESSIDGTIPLEGLAGGGEVVDERLRPTVETTLAGHTKPRHSGE